MPSIAPSHCEQCDGVIPDHRRGHGSPPKTCSETCRRARANVKEKARYVRVKDTAHWKATRAEYLERLRKLLTADPDFATIFRARAAAAVREWAARIKTADPERHEEIKARKRAEQAAWRARLVNDPEAWEQYKAEARDWYRSLSAEQRERIFYAPRRRRQRSKRAES